MDWPRKIKILFSHEDETVHQRVIPLLQQSFRQQVGGSVEIVPQYSAQETLCCATDHIVDLVIISNEYRSGDLSAQALCAQIKNLDKSIPVVVFSSEPYGDLMGIDGWFEFPKGKDEVKSLSLFLRKGQKREKKAS